MEQLTHEIARVRRYVPTREEWRTEHSRAVRNGIYTNVLSAQRAVIQFKSGSYSDEMYKVQVLQGFTNYDDDSVSLEWVDVE